MKSKLYAWEKLGFLAFIIFIHINLSNSLRTSAEIRSFEKNTIPASLKLNLHNKLLKYLRYSNKLSLEKIKDKVLSNKRNVKNEPILSRFLEPLTKDLRNFSVQNDGLIDNVQPLLMTRATDRKENDMTTTLIDFAISKQTSTPQGSTVFRLFEIGGYCINKFDGLYDDPEDCENFIICYAGRTFRTKCALGTMWNHVKKECDFPEAVDCHRRLISYTTGLTAIKTFETKKLTSSMMPKKTSQTKDVNSNLASNKSTKANIVLISILVPIAIVALVVLIVSLWIWNATFKHQKNELKLNNNNINIKTSNCQSRDPNNNESEQLSSSKSLCLCNRIIWSKKNEGIRPYFSHMNGSSNKNTKFSKSHSKNVTRYEDLRNTPNSIKLNVIENCCQIASSSHATLSSHFEENNWDYNFATRGLGQLYLSQPWVRGQYNQGMSEESYAGSLVLKLNPCMDGFDAKNQEINYDSNKSIPGAKYIDTDGYYA